ncbi:MAG TPA: N-acetyltransferase [Thermoanaerobaculia bacterium]|nr:N-acetyltransferase [Thermoanaerobaculia bacterium]
MNIRPYAPADFERLYAVDQAAFSPDLAYSRRELRFYLAGRRALALVAEEEGQIAGFVIAGLASRGRGHIVTLDVPPEGQGKGIGSRLLAAAEERLFNRGARAILLETVAGEEGARGFYERHGYVVVQEIPGYYNGERDAFRMVKRAG